jgi:hypothetical protein
MDTEGYEIPVLLRLLEKDILCQLDQLTVEYHKQTVHSQNIVLATTIASRALIYGLP